MRLAQINGSRDTLAVGTTAADRSAGEHLIRRSLRAGDAAAIADLHRRVYVPEFGCNDEFVGRVAAAVEAAIAAGWPVRAGGVWLIEADGALRGSLALTIEDGERGRLRWFVLDQALRGRGLGRSLVAELLAEARASALVSLELETFSSLSAAARIYRAAGFRLAWERERLDWGTPILYQRYELALR